MCEIMSKHFGFHFSPGHHNVPHSQEQVQVISAMDALTFVNFWILAEDATTDLLPPRPIQKLWVSKKFKYLLETHNWYMFVETFGRNLPPILPDSSHNMFSVPKKTTLFFSTSTTDKMFHSMEKNICSWKKSWDMLRSSPTTAHTGQKLHLLHHLFRNLKPSIFDFGHGIPGSFLGSNSEPPRYPCTGDHVDVALVIRSQKIPKGLHAIHLARNQASRWVVHHLCILDPCFKEKIFPSFP